MLFDKTTRWPHLRELILSGDACLYVLIDQEGASSLLSWIEDRAVTSSPLATLRLQGQINGHYQLQMDSLAGSDAWMSIRSIVKVVDEWVILADGS